MGPILWLLYMETLLRQIPETCRFFAYADDIVIIKSVMTLAEESEMREILTILEEWGDEYKMSWGREKTALLVYGDQRPPNYQISGGAVVPVETATALGVELNDKGTADTMVQKVCDGISRMTNTRK